MGLLILAMTLRLYLFWFHIPFPPNPLKPHCTLAAIYMRTRDRTIMLPLYSTMQFYLSFITGTAYLVDMALKDGKNVGKCRGCSARQKML